MNTDPRFNTIEDAITALKNGRMIIVVDSEDRENEGDFVMAAQDITPDMVNFMINRGRGLVCVPMTDDELKRLDLDKMPWENTAKLGTRFTLSVDAYAGTTTGISSFDRAVTIAALADPNSQGDDFGRPGHVFPIRAVPGGVCVRPGHTEAVVDLCRLSGKRPVGVLCEILSDDGAMARLPELREISQRENMPIVTVEALIDYVRDRQIVSDAGLALSQAVVPTNGAGKTPGTSAQQSGSLVSPYARWEIEPVEKVVEVDFPTRFGEFRLHLFHSRVEGKDHLAITKGEIAGAEDVVTRIHSECLTGDALGSQRCDCGGQLTAALAEIERRGRGVVLYVRQEGRGIGLANKIRAYALQDGGSDTVEANIKLGFEADMRDYTTSAAILRTLGVRSVRLLTNNPKKVEGLIAGGIPVSGREPMLTPHSEHNHEYLKTKRDKMGHIFGELDNRSK